MGCAIIHGYVAMHACALTVLCLCHKSSTPTGLLLASPKDVMSSLDRLGQLLRLPSRRLMGMILKCPGLLCLSPAQLAANHRGAQAGLRLDVAAVNTMIATEPRLLQLDPVTFRWAGKTCVCVYSRGRTRTFLRLVSLHMFAPGVFAS